MKKYSMIAQEKENYCLCSVLQAIFNKYNINIPQKEIAKNLTSDEKGYYFHDKNFENFLSKNNFTFNYYSYNTTPFNEPDFLLKEISENNGFITKENHVLLVVDFKDPLIIYLDPLNAKEKEINYSDLLNKMQRLKKGYFGLIKRIENI